MKFVGFLKFFVFFFLFRFSFSFRQVLFGVWCWDIGCLWIENRYKAFYIFIESFKSEFVMNLFHINFSLVIQSYINTLTGAPVYKKAWEFANGTYIHIYIYIQFLVVENTPQRHSVRCWKVLLNRLISCIKVGQMCKAKKKRKKK